MRPNRWAGPAWRGGLLAALVLATAGLGCGKNRVLTEVDVRSFMHEEDLVNPYSGPPLVPFSFRLEPVAVNLLEGFEDFGEAQAVSIVLEMDFQNVTGQGSGRVALHFEADETSVYAGTPVGEILVDLVPGTTTAGTTRIEADPRVLALFTSKQIWMGVEFGFDPQSVEALQGTSVITKITASLVSTLDVF
jgi:hypothetical protein